MCIKITTGTRSKNDGTLTVNVGSKVVASGHFEKGIVVTDSCFSHLQGISLSNPSNDAWTGKISIKYAGKPTSLRCQGCTGKPLSGFIVVDGDSNGRNQALTQCLNGNTCGIIWEVRGKQLTTFGIKVKRHNNNTNDIYSMMITYLY